MPKGIYDRSKSKFNKGFTGHKHTEETKEINRILHLGKKSRSWNKGTRGLSKGHPLIENPNYDTVHWWVRYWKGRPIICEKCGKYILNKRGIHWANKDHKYRRILDDYIRLCVSCHKKYDIKNNNH